MAPPRLAMLLTCAASAVMVDGLADSAGCEADSSDWCTKAQSKSWCSDEAWGWWMQRNCPTLCCLNACCKEEEIDKLKGEITRLQQKCGATQQADNVIIFSEAETRTALENLKRATDKQGEDGTECEISVGAKPRIASFMQGKQGGMIKAGVRSRTLGDSDERRAAKQQAQAEPNHKNKMKDQMKELHAGGRGGFCVLQDGTAVTAPENRADLYCASPAVAPQKKCIHKGKPHEKCHYIERGCNTADGGSIVITHSRGRKVRVPNDAGHIASAVCARERARRKRPEHQECRSTLTLCVDFIKVSACGPAPSEDQLAQCTVKKMVYGCKQKCYSYTSATYGHTWWNSTHRQPPKCSREQEALAIMAV